MLISIYSRYTRTRTCRHFAGVLEIHAAGSVLEAGMCVSNTLNVLVRVTAAPPTVSRRIAVQPVGGSGRSRRHFVQTKPVVIIRPAVHTINTPLLLYVFSFAID